MVAAMHFPAALGLYISACSVSLLFCISKTQAIGTLGHEPVDVACGTAGGRPGERAPDAAAAAAAAAGGGGGGGFGALRVLEALLQTQLGVFVFSNFVIACCAAIAAITTAIFLESLTPLEAGRLTQRLLKYLLFKVALVGMVVLPSEVTLLHWLPWLAVIGELKMFVGLAKDRLAGLSAAPAVGVSRHLRTLALLLSILAANGVGLGLLRRQRRALSWAVSLLFGLDLGVICVDAAKAVLSCVSLLMDEALAVSSHHAAAAAAAAPPHDPPGGSSGSSSSSGGGARLLARAVAVWDAWQHRGRDTFLYRTELLADVAVHLLTLLHHGHVWLLHGLSFHLLDALLLLDTRAVVVSFLKRVRAHKLHSSATQSLDLTFPDAGAKQLLAAGDADCAICRDRLAAAKQLPCGHLFHLPCLRAWLQQSGPHNFSCPICRLSLRVRRHGAAAKGGGAGGGGAGAAGAGGANTDAPARRGGDQQRRRGGEQGERDQGEQQWHAATAAAAAAAAGAGGGGGRSPNLLSLFSLSMSFDDLSLARGRSSHSSDAASEEEQLLMLHHHHQQQQREEEEEEMAAAFRQAAPAGPRPGGGGGGMAAAALLGARTDEEYEALLAQAIAASLEVAPAPADAAAPGEGQQAAGEGQQAADEERRPRRSGDAAERAGAGGPPGAAGSGSDGGSAGGSAGSSSPRARAAEAAEQPARGQPGAALCGPHGPQHSHHHHRQQQQQQEGRQAAAPLRQPAPRFLSDCGDAAAWSDPLSDSDGAGVPSACNSSSVTRTCSRLLASLVSSSRTSSRVDSSSTTPPPGRSGTSSSTSSRALEHAPSQAGTQGQLLAAAAAAGAGVRGAGGHSSRPSHTRTERRRRSRSCSHLPDISDDALLLLLQQECQQGGQPLPEWAGGAPPAAGAAAATPAADEAATRDAAATPAEVSQPRPLSPPPPPPSPPGMEELLLTPRDPLRRRQGGRWGRRRLVAADSV